MDIKGLVSRLALPAVFAMASQGLVESAAAQEGSSPEAPPGKGEKPNIVFMMADNLGYGDLGCYGGGEIRGMPTPNIDRLASEGIQFTQFFVEPGCTPSRAAFMTGRYSTRCGLSLIVARGSQNTLADEEVTLAEVLKDAGYATNYLGKWHLGMDPKSQPQNQGFDSYYGILNSTDEALFVESMKVAGYTPSASEKAYVWQGTLGSPAEEVEEYTLDVRRRIDLDLADRAEEYIKKRATSDVPFFLFIAWTRPHPPNLVTKEFEGRSRIGVYGDSVVELDHNTGRVLDAIEAAGIEDKTIVVWISDNGAAKTPVWPDGGSNGPFRGELGSAWEGSIRTAGMIKWPGHIKPGKDNGMISIMDFLPTLAAFAGADIPRDRPIDGIDQSDWLLGEKDSSNREHLLTFIGADLVAVRWRQYRVYLQDVIPAGGGYVKMRGMSGNRIPRNGYPYIFNIEADPREEHDVLLYETWVVGKYLPYVAGYYASLREHPNPKPATITDFSE
ncbi:MAG: arylsulfatase [Planctomycetota bacterium]|jgi:arylsulfatase